MIESHAIPYEPARLRGERLLVLAPHPDDEVIACGGLVAQHIRERRTVRVVVATDGAQAGDAALREEESRRALDLLGGAEVSFLRYRDRQLGPDVAPRLTDLLRELKPDLILAPSLTVNFSKAGFMAPDGRCKAFDAKANGYVRSEGAGVVVLKPLSKAQADGEGWGLCR